MTSCEQIIRGPNTGLRRACPGELNAGGICSHKKYHLWQVKSGWCQCGAHEGARPVVNGSPQMTCRLWQHCPCGCHDDISKILAPKKQTRVPYPDSWERRIPEIVKFSQRYDERQLLLKNPELRVKVICEKWSNSDRKTHCTASYIVSQTLEEKPLSASFVEGVMHSWLTAGKAFVGGEPLRFIKFI